MRRIVAVVLGVTVVTGGAVVGGAPEAGADVLCRKKRGQVVSRPTACRKKETAIDVAALIGAGGVGTAQLADGAVDAAKLADGAVDAAKLASGVVPKFLSLNVYGALLGSDVVTTGGVGPNAGLHLVHDKQAGNKFEIGFTIPPNYTPGTPLTVHIVWHTAATGCGIVFRANSLSIARPGGTHLPDSGPTTNGMEVVGGELLTAPATANQSNETLVTIVSPEDGVDLQPGYAINFNMFRSGLDAADTCTENMTIQGIWVEYS